MKKVTSSECNLVLAKKKVTKPIEIRTIVDDKKYTSAYIAELAGELAVLANGVRLGNLTLLLATAQLEAERWSRQVACPEG